MCWSIKINLNQHECGADAPISARNSGLLAHRFIMRINYVSDLSVAL